jgi:Acetyltransferase (isoleucine patch superfamily)
MINIIDKSKCCGCNACGDICPKNAIIFKTDIDGFWYPEVNKERCINCHLCENICPIINVNELKKNDFQRPICYAAEHKNIEVIFDSTSGGLFSALADIMYKEKGFVGGAIFNSDFSVSHHISNDKHDLAKLRSSKYLQSNNEGFFKKVRDYLKAGEKVLVCGCPCQMAAMRSFLGKDYDNLIISDFVCRSIDSPKAWHKYLDTFYERYGSKVVYAKAKSKEYGWRNLTQKVILENGKHVYDTKDKQIAQIGSFITHALSRPSCYDCKFKGFPRIADITIGDFWGIEHIKQDTLKDKDLGTSLAMINSKKGEFFFERVKMRLNYIEVPFETTISGNASFYKPLAMPIVDRKRLFEDIDKMPFFEVAKKYGFYSYPISKKQKIKDKLRIIRDILSASKCKPVSIFRILRHNSIKDIYQNKFILFYPYSFVQFARGANIIKEGRINFGSKRYKNSKLETRMLVDKGGTLKVSGNICISYGADIEVFSGGELTIKGGFVSNLNTVIVCAKKIEIGQNVGFGRNITIRDNNGDHYLNIPGYKDTAPVIIGDKVWLCESCTIMPGVKIGDGAIIGAHSVVYSNVPAHSLVSGNPAKVILNNVLWKE